MIRPTGAALIPLSVALWGLGCNQQATLSFAAVAITGSGSVVVTDQGGGDYTVDFGSVAVGQTRSAVLTLANGGSAPLLVLEVGAPSDAQFGVSLAVGTTVSPGQSIDIPVYFKPFAPGSAGATASIRVDQLMQPITLHLSGLGVVARLGVTPESLDFGLVPVHGSRAQSVTVTNDSMLDLLITPGQVQGTAAPVFALDPAAPFTLKAGGSLVIAVTYAPLGPSSLDAASFTVSSATGNSVTVSLRGVAAESGLLLSPSPLDFNFVQPGTPRTLSLRIANVGSQGIDLHSIALTPSSAGFSLVDSQPQAGQLAAGQSIDVKVSFAPTEFRHYSGSLEVTSDDNLALQTVVLQGYGGGAAITCSATALDFGLAATNLSVVQSFTCMNTGTDVDVSGAPDPDAMLAISGFTVLGANGAFGASLDPQSVGKRLASGHSARVDVAYTPKGAGQDLATLTVLSNVTTPPAPPVLALSGQGVPEAKCYYSLTSTSLVWPEVLPNAGQFAQAFTLTNIGPNECLIASVNVEPGSDPVFSVGPLASQRLSPPGSGGAFPTSVTVPVFFAPTVPGQYAGAIDLIVSSPDAPSVRVALSATAGTSCFQVKPTALDFGVVGKEGSQYCATPGKTFVGINGCGLPVTIDEATVTAGVPFSLIPPALPVTLLPGKTSDPFEVTFGPTAPGASFGSVALQTDLQATPLGVFFQGRGAAAATQTDRFPSVPPVADILWVMDTDDDDFERAVVAAKASSFISGLIAMGVDFQIAVTTSDVCGGVLAGDAEGGRILPCPGCKIDGSVPSLITAEDPTAGDDLQALLTIGTRVGNACASDEEFFESAYEGVVTGPGATYNKKSGFFRPGAYLAVITVNGDQEDDNSRAQAPDWYANELLSLQGSDTPHKFSWSYIAPTGWGKPGGEQPFNRLSQRLASLLELVGGVALDTTQKNWELGLQDLWQLIFEGASAFPLSGNPDPNTIKVYLDGPPPGEGGPGEPTGVVLDATNTNGSWNWKYDTASNRVEINSLSLRLTTGDTVYVQYTLQCP